MSVDRYVPAAIDADAIYSLPAGKGSPTKTLVTTFEKAATDVDGSVLRFARGLSTEVIVGLQVECDAIAGATDIDVGIYKGESGEVVDADLLGDGLTLAVEKVCGAGLNGIAALPKDSRVKNIQELAGQDTVSSTIKGGYDLALTGNTFGANTGTINIILTLAC